MTIFCWAITRVWKIVYYRFHVLVCILHNVVYHFIREKKFEQWRWVFHRLSSTSRTRLTFVHILSSSFMDLFVFICFPFHFYHFIGDSVFKITLSLWWCIIIIVIIQNIIKSFEPFFRWTDALFLDSFDLFFFHNVFHIELFFFISFNFLFYLGYIVWFSASMLSLPLSSS